MKNILFLIGTRPEAIKMAPLIKCFSQSHNFKIKVALTGQHRKMLDQVIDFFEIKVHFDLDVMTHNQTLPALTSTLIERITSEILLPNHFNYVFVQGDTTTVLAGALAAFYQKIKIIHIEAGLRSNDMQNPFPEEMNRVLVSKLADYHFCPTDIASQNLVAENIHNNVFVVGNTVIDALFYGLKKVKSNSEKLFLEKFNFVDFSKKIILVTCHRRENFGKPFDNIALALIEIANVFDSHAEIVYVTHPNPNIKADVRQKLHHKNIHLVEALAYPELIWILSKTYIAITDSGGIQEEAPSLGKPVLVLRDVTERTEGVRAGTAILVGTKTTKIVAEATRLLSDFSYYKKMSHVSNPYGDGTAANQILNTMLLEV